MTCRKGSSIKAAEAIFLLEAAPQFQPSQPLFTNTPGEFAARVVAGHKATLFPKEDQKENMKKGLTAAEDS